MSWLLSLLHLFIGDWLWLLVLDVLVASGLVDGSLLVLFGTRTVRTDGVPPGPVADSKPFEFSPLGFARPKWPTYNCSTTISLTR